MTDGTNGQAAPATAAQSAPGQPAQSGSSQYSVPQGYRLVSDDDHQKFSRYEQQVRGFQPLYERAQKYGLKSPEDFDRHAKVFDLIAKKKINPEALSSMFSGEADEDLNVSGAKNFDPDAYKQELMKEAEAKFYELQHKSSANGDQKLLEQAFKELVGEDELDELSSSTRKAWLSNYVNENREFYPEGHPLREKYYAPISESLVKKAISEYRNLENKVKASKMADTGKAALKATRPVGTVAGNGGGQGKPNTEIESLRDGNKPSKEAVEAAYAARKAARGR